MFGPKPSDLGFLEKAIQIFCQLCSRSGSMEALESALPSDLMDYGQASYTVRVIERNSERIPRSLLRGERAN